MKFNRGSTSVSIRLNPGTFEGVQADWWLYLKNGDIYYSYRKGKWQQGTKPLPFFQGRLCQFRMDDLVIPFAGPGGAYTLHFGVDRRLDGALTIRNYEYATQKIFAK